LLRGANKLLRTEGSKVYKDVDASCGYGRIRLKAEDDLQSLGTLKQPEQKLNILVRMPVTTN